jgi:AcrR family transcriptional regulator
MTAASEIVSSEGLDGLTMQAVADRVDCAVGTIYTYFASKSSLLTALQIAAIETLGASFRLSRGMWEEELAASELDESTRALVRLLAFGQLFASAPSLHPREFELLQFLLSTPKRTTSDEDARRVLPYALGLINEFRTLIEAAVENDALRPDTHQISAEDYSLGRTIRWAGALNGALLVSNVADVPPEDGADGPDLAAFARELVDGPTLALLLARDLLAGWGAPADRLEAAEAFVEDLRDADRLAVQAVERKTDLDGDGLVDPDLDDQLDDQLAEPAERSD